jgi:hypothetical protein
MGRIIERLQRKNQGNGDKTNRILFLENLLDTTMSSYESKNHNGDGMEMNQEECRIGGSKITIQTRV